MPQLLKPRRPTKLSTFRRALARSEVRLESLYGRPVLRARTWSNRNGKLREWTWEARHDGPIE